MTHFIPFLFLSQNLRRIHLHDLAYLTGDDGSNEANHYHNTQDDRESRIDFYHFEHLTQNDMEQQHGYHRKYHGDERNHQIGSSEEFGNILCQSTITLRIATSFLRVCVSSITVLKMLIRQITRLTIARIHAIFCSISNANISITI